MEKTKIYFGLKYWVSSLFILLLSIVTTIICLMIFKFDDILFTIIFLILMCSTIIISAVWFLWCFQYAILTDDYIEFRSALCLFKRLELDEINLVRKEKLMTFSSSIGMQKFTYWLVFYTKEKATAKSGYNSRNGYPYKIPFSDKNIKIICDKFSKNKVDFN